MPAAATALATNISHNNLTGYTFSCKSAVQAWYNGDTTGQNANYGIMLRYYNESVADYNAVYSADYTDESKRPNLTIIYQPSSTTIRVLEGKTYTLATPNVSGTITWTSSNTSAATVNTSGKLTAIKAGVTTISATVDGVVHKRYTVYVTIADGIYYIKNANIGLYLGTYGGTTDSTAARLLAKVSTGTSLCYQLWKVTYLGSGYYSIRPVYKLDMALRSNDGGTVELTTIGEIDSLSAVPLASRWTIEYDTTGYVFRYTGSGSMAMRSANGSASPGLGVITAVYSSTTTFRWTLEKPLYRAEVYNFYDNGYSVRYGESTNASAATIYQYSNAIAKRYLELLNFEVAVYYPSYFSSALDNCKVTVTSSNIDSVCGHSDNHDERQNVILDFKSHYVGSNTRTYAYWTGHRIESTSSAGDININRSCSSGYHIFMLELSTEENRELYSIGVLMHELNHQYGARDHYHELTDANDPTSCKFKDVCSECGTNKRPKTCIMYQSRIDISKSTVICDLCKQDITEHLAAHHET